MSFDRLATAVSIAIFSMRYLKSIILKPSTGVAGLITC